MTKREKYNLVTGIMGAICLIVVLMTLGLNGKIKTKKVELKQLRESVAKCKEDTTKLNERRTILENSLSGIKDELVQCESQLDTLKNSNPTIKDLIDNPENVKYAYLTFDDGPSENTNKILDILKENDIKATFFVVGSGDTSLYKRIVEEGHTIALHSNTHEYDKIYTSVDSYMSDLKELSNKVEELTGVKSKIVRFPGGSINDVSAQYGGNDIMTAIKSKLKIDGYTWFDWNIDSQDAATSNQEKQVIIDSVLKNMGNRKQAVILMHDASTKETTVQALQEIITGLKQDGYVLTNIKSDTKPLQFNGK